MNDIYIFISNKRSLVYGGDAPRRFQIMELREKDGKTVFCNFYRDNGQSTCFVFHKKEVMSLKELFKD